MTLTKEQGDEILKYLKRIALALEKGAEALEGKQKRWHEQEK